MLVREANADLALLARAHADDGLVDLGQHGSLADRKGVAALAVGLEPLGGEGVVDDDHIAGGGRALHAAELRVLLAHLLEGVVDVLVGDRRGRVLDVEAVVLAERDGGLDLHHRLEAERRRLPRAARPQVGLVDGLELGLADRLAIDVGDQVLGDLAADVIGEVQLDQRARHVPLAEAGQARLLLDAAVGALPLLVHHVEGRLDGEAPLARFQ